MIGPELICEQMVSMPFSSISAAHVHESGMTQWCKAAGPQSITSEFGLKVFEDIRWCIVGLLVFVRRLRG